MQQEASRRERRWAERVSRTGYFFGALLLHLIIFIMVAGWIVSRPPAPQEDLVVHYIIHTSPPETVVGTPKNPNEDIVPHSGLTTLSGDLPITPNPGSTIHLSGVNPGEV